MRQHAGVLARAKSALSNLSHNLGFVPGLVVVAFAVGGIVVVEVDEHLDLDQVGWVFRGDGAAARTVLSVIAGSLITVAGLTFSITMVVLQLASSQFSPRILRTFFGDRITQVTIGIYVGTFVYSILVLRAVGSYGDEGFVPRLGVTLASLLGIGAVVLLIVFLHHVSRMVQVSHVTARIARATLARTDRLFPEDVGAETGEDAPELLGRWRAERPGARVMARRPGFVQRLSVEDLAGGVRGDARRVGVLVAPGDFVGVDDPLAEVWPPDAAARCEQAVLDAVTVADERDIAQDAGFGLRQLSDIALKAMSPGINDPMTAVTCIHYMRSVLVRLTERQDPPGVQRFADLDVTLVLRRTHYEEYLETLREVSRYAAADAWVSGEILQALAGCGRAAVAAPAPQRTAAIRSLAESVAEQAIAEAGTESDRARIAEALSAVPR